MATGPSPSTATAPRRGGLVAVGGADHREVGDQPQRHRRARPAGGSDRPRRRRPSRASTRRRLGAWTSPPGGRRPHVVAEHEERAADRQERRRACAMPTMVEPMACSRMPKWIWTPSGVPGSSTGLPGSLVPVLPVRSARAGHEAGHDVGQRLDAAPDATRVGRLARRRRRSGARPPSRAGPGDPSVASHSASRPPSRAMGALLPVLTLHPTPRRRPRGRGQHVIGDVEVLVRQAHDLLGGAMSSASNARPWAAGSSVCFGDG